MGFLILFLCLYGEIGIHARFKIWFLRECRFDSDYRYHRTQLNILITFTHILLLLFFFCYTFFFILLYTRGQSHDEKDFVVFDDGDNFFTQVNAKDTSYGISVNAGISNDIEIYRMGIQNLLMQHFLNLKVLPLKGFMSWDLIIG